MRHTRVIQRGRTKRPNTAAANVIVEQRLEAVVHPATLNQVAYLAADAKGLGVLKQKRKNRAAITDLLYLTIPAPP
ncbi:MAG: hypothetical protein HGB28_00320 [Oscillochloris sp.]|nr:hypothetical protein [Oscillochloris sp.]